MSPKATALRPAPAGPAAWAPLDAERLQAGLQRLAAPLSQTRVAAITHFAKLLLKWNRTFNLLGATTTEALIDDHLLDSLTVLVPLARWIGPSAGCLHDVGAGAGLPGIPIAVAHPEWRVNLIEPIGKKAAFLRQVAAECALANVSVFEDRIEALPKEPGAADGGPHHFISRAFTSLNRYAELCAPHTSEHSLLFAMKAARVAEELDALPATVRVQAVERLRPATAGTQRYLVVMSLNPYRDDNRRIDWPSS